MKIGDTVKIIANINPQLRKGTWGIVRGFKNNGVIVSVEGHQGTNINLKGNGDCILLAWEVLADLNLVEKMWDEVFVRL